jgi:hypothetical protein
MQPREQIRVRERSPSWSFSLGRLRSAVSHNARKACTVISEPVDHGMRISIYGTCMFVLISIFPFASMPVYPAHNFHFSFCKMLASRNTFRCIRALKQLIPFPSGVHLALIFVLLGQFLRIPIPFCNW